MLLVQGFFFVPDILIFAYYFNVLYYLLSLLIFYFILKTPYCRQSYQKYNSLVSILICFIHVHLNNSYYISTECDGAPVKCENIKVVAHLSNMKTSTPNMKKQQR